MLDKNMITILIVPPFELPYEAIIANELCELQRLVGGYIEAAYPFDEPVALICNEDGKLKNLPINRRVGPDFICGPFLICGLDDAMGDFSSLSPAQIARYKRLFSNECGPSFGKQIQELLDECERRFGCSKGGTL